MKKFLLILLLGLGLPWALPIAHADPRWQLAASDDWQNLSDEERRHLGPHRGQWRHYSPDQRERLRQGVQRYRSLSPEERERVQRQRERFESLSPEERQRLRERYYRER
jgi:hypothetical protein